MTGGMVALGDSISVGVGDTVGPECVHGPGWAAHLAAVLGAGTFRNLASNGARAGDVVDEQLPAALALRPQLATLVVGGNDALRSDFSPPSVGRDVAAAVRALRDVGATVVLATLPPIGLFELAPAPVRRVMRARIDAVNTVVRVAAAGAGADAVVVDVAAAVRDAGPRAWHVDRVHPSALGHRALAVAAARALAPELLPDDPIALLSAPAASRRVGGSLAWLVAAGVPWALRRGRDLLPGLARAVVGDLRTGVRSARVGIGPLEDVPAATHPARPRATWPDVAADLA